MFTRLAALLLASWLAGCASTERAPACDPGEIDVRPTQLSPGDINRLRAPPLRAEAREQAAYLYLDAHCDEVISDYIVGARRRNHSCVIPGASEKRIVIGAHYDKTRRGDGVVDNWTGVMLVAKLLAAFEGSVPSNTLEFVMFGEEEPGMLGSRDFLSRHGNANDIVAMINLDTFGIGPVTIDRRSSKTLQCFATAVGTALGIETRNSYLRQTVGDWEPFKQRSISVLNLNSLDQKGLRLIHSRRDNFNAIDPARMQETWQFVLNLLVNLDRQPGLTVRATR